MSPTLERRLGWALLALTLVLGLVRLGAGDILTPEEARTIGIAQDVLRGHVLWPTFNDGVVPPEPPAHAWLVAGAIRVAGFSEAVARIPGVLAWVALVALTIQLGRDLGAPVVGLIAGLLLAATPGLATAARLAQPSVTFAVAEAMALRFAWQWLRTEQRTAATRTLVAGTAAWAVGGAMGLGLLLAIVAWTLGWRGALGRLRRFPTPLGVASVVLLAGAWYVAGALRLGEPFVSRHLAGPELAHLARAFAWEEPWSERSPIFHLTFHLIALVRTTLPWTPLLVAGLLAARDPRVRRDPRIQFLLTWTGMPIVLYLLSPQKAWTDMLVALPALAILAAHAAHGLARRWPRPLHVSAQAMLPAAGLTLLALGGVTFFVYHPGLLARADRNWLEALIAATGNGGATLLGIAGALGGLGAGLIAARAWPLVTPAFVLVGLAWNAIAIPRATQAASDAASLRPFATAIDRMIRPDDPVVFFGRTQRPIVVYLDRVVPSLRHDASALPTGAFVILRARAYEELSAAGRLSPPLLQGGGRMHDGRPGHVVFARVLAPPPPPSLLDHDPA